MNGIANKSSKWKIIILASKLAFYFIFLLFSFWFYHRVINSLMIMNSFAYSITMVCLKSFMGIHSRIFCGWLSTGNKSFQLIVMDYVSYCFSRLSKQLK